MIKVKIVKTVEFFTKRKFSGMNIFNSNNHLFIMKYQLYLNTSNRIRQFYVVISETVFIKLIKLFTI